MAMRPWNVPFIDSPLASPHSRSSLSSADRRIPGRRDTGEQGELSVSLFENELEPSVRGTDHPKLVQWLHDHKIPRERVYHVLVQTAGITDPDQIGILTEQDVKEICEKGDLTILERRVLLQAVQNSGNSIRNSVQIVERKVDRSSDDDDVMGNDYPKSAPDFSGRVDAFRDPSRKQCIICGAVGPDLDGFYSGDFRRWYCSTECTLKASRPSSKRTSIIIQANGHNRHRKNKNSERDRSAPRHGSNLVPDRPIHPPEFLDRFVGLMISNLPNEIISDDGQLLDFNQFVFEQIPAKHVEIAGHNLRVTLSRDIDKDDAHSIRKRLGKYLTRLGLHIDSIKRVTMAPHTQRTWDQQVASRPSFTASKSLQLGNTHSNEFHRFSPRRQGIPFAERSEPRGIPDVSPTDTAPPDLNLNLHLHQQHSLGSSVEYISPRDDQQQRHEPGSPKGQVLLPDLFDGASHPIPPPPLDDFGPPTPPNEIQSAHASPRHHSSRPFPSAQSHRILPMGRHIADRINANKGPGSVPNPRTPIRRLNRSGTHNELFSIPPSKPLKYVTSDSLDQFALDKQPLISNVSMPFVEEPEPDPNRLEASKLYSEFMKRTPIDVVFNETKDGRLRTWNAMTLIGKLRGVSAKSLKFSDMGIQLLVGKDRATLEEFLQNISQEDADIMMNVIQFPESQQEGRVPHRFSHA